MAAFTVNHRYYSFSDGKHYGPYEAGAVVDLDQAEAQWVNRDSPGTLTAVAAKKAEDKVEQPPTQPNRAHKGGRNRAGA